MRMKFDRIKPYNQLPTLPPKTEIETQPVLKRCIKASRALAELKQAGLKGVEVYYPGHGPELTARYERLADRHGLLVTGGTDFHGAVNPGVHIGIGRGGLRIPYRLVEELKRSSTSV